MPDKCTILVDVPVTKEPKKFHAKKGDKATVISMDMDVGILEHDKTKERFSLKLEDFQII